MKTTIDPLLRLAALAALASVWTPYVEATAVAKPPSRTSSRAAGHAADSFGGSMHDAMARMDEGMAIACTGDPDRDFAAMMIPHHQGAVDMALVELRFGSDERLRRLAQGIIVEQKQEIALMQEILGGAPPR